jgi:hypothetical protein
MLIRYLTLALALLASSPATAQPIPERTPMGRTTDVVYEPPKNYVNMLPPAQYDKPYTGKLTITRVDTKEAIAVMCPDSEWGCAVPPGRTCMGCAVPPDRRCDIYIANDEILKTHHHLTYAFALRHELGHCNGWADHEGGAVGPHRQR